MHKGGEGRKKSLLDAQEHDFGAQANTLDAAGCAPAFGADLNGGRLVELLAVCRRDRSHARPDAGLAEVPAVRPLSRDPVGEQVESLAMKAR